MKRGDVRCSRHVTDRMSLMTYTGDVVSGGPSDRRDLPLLTIRKMSVGVMEIGRAHV